MLTNRFGMSSRIRNLALAFLCLPVLIFYGFLIYPWDFSESRGLGWLMLMVLFGLAALCAFCALVSLGFAVFDEKKVRWIVALFINLVPVAQFLIPPLIG